MLTLNINYDVLPDRLITIKLPETVRLGRHELVIVVDEQPIPSVHASHNAAKLNDFIKQRYELSLCEPVQDAEEIFTSMATRHAG
ncbi:MAG: hypothetical protein RI893_1426 [Pseudomonadota bacterium]|jgi:hypothetical protein